MATEELQKITYGLVKQKRIPINGASCIIQI